MRFQAFTAFAVVQVSVLVTKCGKVSNESKERRFQSPGEKVMAALAVVRHHVLAHILLH
jgi:hypothetical protein